MKKVSFYTLGCRVNQYETRKIMEKLPLSVEIVPFGQDCDLTVINSCIVTKQAERESRQYISRARRHTQGDVILTGCYVEVAFEPFDDPHLMVCAGQDKTKIAEIICHKLGVSGEGRGFSLLQTVARPSLLVQTGCNKKCTYCIIHTARGPAVSRNVHDIINEMKEIFRCGVDEIVLTGINIGSWGTDLPGKAPVSVLLKAMLEEVPDNKRLRMGSIEPEYVTPDLIELFQSDKLAPHIHLPFQSLADPVLRAMGRPNTVSEYIDTVRKLRKVRDISVGGDIITGFPGETPEDHAQCMKNLEIIVPSYLHVFPYSPRQGTLAAEMRGYDHQTARERALEVRQLASIMKTRYLESLTGKTLLVVSERSLGEGHFMGTSGEFVSVSFESSDMIPSGQIVSVLIEKAEDGILRGRVI